MSKDFRGAKLYLDKVEMNHHARISILLLISQMSSGMCRWWKWAWLAGRGRYMESRPELETVNK